MKRSIIVFAIISTLTPGLALAKLGFVKAFKQAYPAAKSIQKCILCHEAGGNKLNYFGQDFQKAKYDFKAIEALDSDGDTFTNLEEITKETYPGDKTSFPPKAE